VQHIRWTCAFCKFVITDSYDVIFFAAFLLIVLLKYFQQNVTQQVEDGEAQAPDKEHQQALLVAEPEEEPQQAVLVVAEQRHQR